MRLSTKVRYGVRALFDIAYHSSGMPIQIKDISKRQDISQRYLEQIFQKLRKGGLLKSKRGPRGGYTLAKQPADISIGDVIMAVEDGTQLVPCVKKKTRSTKKCKQYEACATRVFWDEASEKIFEYFCSIAIQDICDKAKDMGIKRELDYRFMYFI
ncbi:RrF2 family transcriptional regulator [Thermodesulfobacteriota bacterium]